MKYRRALATGPGLAVRPERQRLHGAGLKASKGHDMKRVRANARYVYEPVPLDRLHPPYGVNAGLIGAGDTVQVVNLPGCPRANTMGHCHIQTVAGVFAGLVCVNSLQPRRR